MFHNLASQDMLEKQQKADCLLCLNRVKDNYLALHSLISLTLMNSQTAKLNCLSKGQEDSFWRIQFALLIEQVILTHCKLNEVKQKYARFLPSDERRDLNCFFKDKEEPLNSFRNKCSGHLIDKSTGRPLETEVLQELVVKIFGKNDLKRNIVPSFFDKHNPSNPSALVNIIQRCIDSLGEHET